ncbi:MAG: hypothetical protein IPK73_22540 [Candidatus Obscuribacter sp.]|nr:hypothetical protein [Candidatus Obscuribacter sp.]MBK9276889.1 hypothetical protein [Candidatus Obscuribacter sp.]
MLTQRAQWPHTVADITKALDGVWGLCGAHGLNGNLYRLERSLHEPIVYTFTEYRGEDESDIVKREEYSLEDRQIAVDQFAKALGFGQSN